MIRFLLDTNVLSEPLRPDPIAPVLRRLRIHAGELATAAPVWHELRFGCARLSPSRKRDALTRYLEEVVRRTVPILPYDEAAASWHAGERARLSRTGRTAPFVDGQIAAIARVHGLTLVTANEGDYRVYEGIKVENWARGGRAPDPENARRRPA